MAQAAPGFTLAFTADTDMGPYLIAKFGSVDGNCALAAASTDALLGVTDSVGVAAGQTASIVHDGSAYVTYGGTVAAGDFLTSDANGKAIKVSPAGGTNAFVIGQALEAGVSGDVHAVLLNVTRIQG